MALYKYGTFLVKSDDKAFDETYKPGENCPYSGIYSCEACDEIASNEGNPFPPQNHHQHPVGTGAIRWRLTVHPVQKD
jgi:hypothetical protein